MLAWLALIIISIAIGVDPFHSLRSKVDTAAAALHEEEEEVDDDDFNEVGRVKKNQAHIQIDKVANSSRAHVI